MTGARDGAEGARTAASSTWAGTGTARSCSRGRTLASNLRRIDKLGQPGSYNHFPVGWAIAMNAPFRLCKQYTHLGGTRSPLVVHWPKGIRAHGELRTQFHHEIDIVPTILHAIGIDPPAEINSVPQGPLEGVPMNDARAPTKHRTQYFEMLGNRAIIDGMWKAVTYHGRKPWESRAAWSFDDDHWEFEVDRHTSAQLAHAMARQ